MEPERRKVRLADKTGGLVWSRVNMREQSEYCDITLISQEGEKFPAHRLILGVTSSYLRAKMQKNSVPKIVMKTIKTEVLSALLTFIYEGETVIKEADTELFIEMAQKWRIQQFLRVKRKKKAEKIITSSIGLIGGVGGGDGGGGGGGPRTEKAQRQHTYSCNFCDSRFPTKIKLEKHIKKKTFKLSEISGELDNLITTDDCGWTACFCGYRNKLQSRVLAHAQRFVEDLKFKCEDCEHMAKTKAALYKHRSKHARK